MTFPYHTQRLNEMGFQSKAGPREVTIDGHWAYLGRTTAYTVVRINAIDFHDRDRQSLIRGNLLGWHRPWLPAGNVYTGGEWIEEETVLIGKRLPDDRKGGWLQTVERFGEFELEFDVHPDWGCDTGVLLRQNARGGGIQITIDYRNGGNIGFLHGQGIGSFYTRPFSLHGDVDGNGKLLRLTAEEHYNARQQDGLIAHCSSADFLGAWKINDWNHIKIRCVGADADVTIWVNALKTCEMRSPSFKAAHPLKPQNAPYDAAYVREQIGIRGHIGLQIHPGKNWAPGGAVRYRKMEIRELD